jgi:Fe-S-cluster containining protein
VEALKGGRTPLVVLEVAESATALADEMVNQAKARLPPPKLACKEGCDWCCHQRVGAAAPEVFRIIAHLRQTLPPEEFEMFRKRVIAADTRRRAVKAEGGNSARWPCVLLVEHRCAAYAVRPLTCRGFNSRDARRCELSLDAGHRLAVPAYTPQVWVNTFALDGMRAGLNESRLKGDLLELTGALRIALEERDSIERWGSGEAFFAPARIE